MKKGIIAIDIDDVIADGTGSLIGVVNAHTGAELTRKHYLVPGDYWGYYERVWEEHGLEVDFAALNTDMVIDQSHVPLLPGAAFALAELSKQYDLVVITARNPSWEQATLKWLGQNCPDIFRKVLFVGGHSEATKTKGQLCAEVGASWLIDDNVEHCSSATEKGVKAVLFGEYGWHHKAPKDLPKCRDWQAVLEYFNAA